MGKRHNRKRTRSRPRHRDGIPQNIYHTRSISVDTTTSQTTSNSSYQYLSQFPTTNVHADHWHQTYFAWQHRLQVEQERQQVMEVQRLRYFGGEPGEDVSLLEPMLQVVMDLFDGNTDYEDP
ncbi:hypothetical protein CC86DRAFT_393227 [Ophiobolus disseminans]|uniref:Uncharacterized protein n=1 Tax=Ophiobolus disseminans TaxID=1469910 RepID=A0A6A7A4I8_9PLEO|nr:hypothetical protein CC86DRAFT_393227 [Ophiobolus disseminans]